MIFVIGSGFAWAVSNILMKMSGKIDMFRLIIWVSIVPPIPLFLISLFYETGHKEILMGISWSGEGAVIYTALFLTVLAYGLWGRLFREYSANIVAPFSLLVPVFGVLASCFVLKERVSIFEIICSCFVFTGLFFVVFGQKVSVKTF